MLGRGAWWNCSELPEDLRGEIRRVVAYESDWLAAKPIRAAKPSRTGHSNARTSADRPRTRRWPEGGLEPCNLPKADWLGWLKRQEAASSSTIRW